MHVEPPRHITQVLAYKQRHQIRLEFDDCAQVRRCAYMARDSQVSAARGTRALSPRHHSASIVITALANAAALMYNLMPSSAS
jgi:hypothetical protein